MKNKINPVVEGNPYIPPVIQVISVELENGLAAGSAVILVQNPTQEANSIDS